MIVINYYGICHIVHTLKSIAILLVSELVDPTYIPLATWPFTQLDCGRRSVYTLNQTLNRYKNQMIKKKDQVFNSTLPTCTL